MHRNFRPNTTCRNRIKKYYAPVIVKKTTCSTNNQSMTRKLRCVIRHNRIE